MSVPPYATTFVVSIANFGGVLSTWIFNDPPRFRNAIKINLAFSDGECVLAENKRKEGERAVGQPPEGNEEAEVAQRSHGHPDSIHTL